MDDQQTPLEGRRLGVPGNGGAHGTIPDLPQKVRILLETAATLAEDLGQNTLDGGQVRWFFFSGRSWSELWVDVIL